MLGTGAPPSSLPRLPAAAASRLVWVARALTGLGALLCAVAAVVDPQRLGFSYLVGFAFTVTVALGGLFFVVLQHLVRAGWSVAPRRQMEWLAAALPVLLVLFVPVALLAHRVYPWLEPGAMRDHALHAKAAWLNEPFFLVRAGAYLAAWGALGWYFSSRSRAQDATGDKELTVRMRTWSAPAMVLFALTLTFASFDWLMSLSPHWFSTIFGVYVFAGATVSSLAVLALWTLWLQATCPEVRAVSTVEHQHDIGKLLFGFVVFWAYIAFSQFFLIWYANVPEETVWFLRRWEGSWQAVSLTLVIGHFVLPFVLLISRTGKRSPRVLAFAAALLVVMHWLDLYWLVMPVRDPYGARFTWFDLAGMLLPLGALLWAVAARASRDAVYPARDPLLAEAARLENA